MNLTFGKGFERYLLPLVLLIFLIWSSPALFWGTQKIPDLARYNLHPDERTHLRALNETNLLATHWDGAGYSNLLKALNQVLKWTGFGKYLERIFVMQEYGPILLVARFINILLVFASATLVLGLLKLVTGNTFFSYLGFFFYLTTPAVQVSGHYMRPHILINFLLIVLLCLHHYSEDSTSRKQQNIGWMFLLSGFLFSLRYPFGFVIVLPVYLLLKSRDYLRILRYSGYTVAGAFAINPYFFIHLKTSLQVIGNAPYAGKMQLLFGARTFKDFLSILNPIHELKEIFITILPNSVGTPWIVILFGLSIAAYLLWNERIRIIDASILFLSYYLFLWIIWGQTVTDGLSRLALPFIILISLLIPIIAFQISQRHMVLNVLNIVLGIFLCIPLILFSTQLMNQMNDDPRIRTLDKIRNEKQFLFLDDMGWDYGFFSSMPRVRIVPRKSLLSFDGCMVLYVDIAVHPHNPYSEISQLKLEEVFQPPRLFWWSDNDYLHDYRYFSPTIYIWRIHSRS